MRTVLLQQQKILKDKAAAGKILSRSELNSLAKIEADLEDFAESSDIFDTPEQVAEYGGYKSGRTVYNDVSKGMLIRQDDGSFLQDDVDIWLSAKGRKPKTLLHQPPGDEETPENKIWNKADEDAKYRFWRAKREKILVKRLEGESLPKKEVVRQQVNRAHEYKTSLLLFSRSVSHKIAAELGVEAKAVSLIIDDEAKRILKAMSRRLELNVG